MRKIITISCLCIIIAASLYAILATSAATRRKAPDISNINVHLAVQRLEQKLFALESKEAIRTFLRDHQRFATQFLGATSPTAENKLVAQLYAMIKDPHIQALYQETQQVFGDFSAIQQQFEVAFRYLRYYYPAFTPPKIVTFITGMDTDLHLSDDLVVIGLDFFMGEGAKFRPIAPQYIRRAYQPTCIVPQTMLLLSQQFIKTDNTDQTLLADMMYYGKAYYFAQALLPEVEASVLLAYTPAQLADVEQHQDIIWAHFIEHELLYVTNHLTKHRYISDRPFVAEISQRCPGNIGKWLGWAFIKAYMKKHPNVDLPTLMSNPNTQALFSQSGYRPKN